MAPTPRLSLLDARTDGVLFQKPFKVFLADTLPARYLDSTELTGIDQSADGPLVDLE